ncbi:MAG: hypothetical protein CFK49_01495 [Armatimonadetes bacterium JP3_11]|nr:MAG: hypothetical protein CFK49_01495 [Armatimonadetes bacterium JP3_11]
MLLHRGILLTKLTWSDPTLQQGAVIEPTLKGALYRRERNPIGAPRRYSLYDLYRAMLYGLVNGIH